MSITNIILKRLAKWLVKNLKIDKIMANIKQLQAQVEELQSALDTEQEQIATAIADLQASVSRLEALAVEAGTEEERTALSEKIQGIVDDLKATIPDAAEEESTTTTTTVEETPTEEPLAGEEENF